MRQVLYNMYLETRKERNRDCAHYSDKPSVLTLLTYLASWPTNACAAAPPL